jgi:hypothetical protein
MPNQPRADNPARSVRIDDELWAAVEREAREKVITMSAVIRAAIEDYFGGTKTPKPPPPARSG